MTTYTVNLNIFASLWNFHLKCQMRTSNAVSNSNYSALSTKFSHIIQSLSIRITRMGVNTSAVLGHRKMLMLRVKRIPN
jgi:hypothetical protein